MNSIEKDIAKVLISEEEVGKRVKELGEKISRDYQGKSIIVICVLKGAIIFYSDLARYIDVPLEMDFMAVSSYGSGTKSTGVVRILKDLSVDIQGKHLLLVEDILDTGNTLHYLSENLKSRNPASFKICTLLDKPERRVADIHADYVGFVIPDDFVVGYGLDYNQGYRNLPYIGVLKKDVYHN